jgi:hypothetical protein
MVVAAALSAREALAEPAPRSEEKLDRVTIPVSLGWPRTTEEELRSQLRSIPEIVLDDAPSNAKTAAAAKEIIKKKVAEAQRLNNKQVDGFVLQLRQARPDLAGLPFRLGKECELPKEQARTLQGWATDIRSGLHDMHIELDYLTTRQRVRQASMANPHLPYYDVSVSVFWSKLHNRLSTQFARSKGQADTAADEAALRAFQQLLLAEGAQMRRSCTEFLIQVKTPPATAILAQIAAFDLDPDIRALAVAGLAKRPAQDYQKILHTALRYPWAPVATNAAEALCRLEAKGTAQHLVELLDQPDPGRPFLATVNHREVPMIRELVRVNHLRNCLLCHAPITGTANLDSASFKERRAALRDVSDSVPGLIPTPLERVPPPFSSAYYADREGELVRAAVTYLRQDFSVVQPVDNHGKWPKEQRFDFLVRTRPLTDEEREQWEAQKIQAEPTELSEHKKIDLSALRTLTGLDAGNTGRQWRAALDGAPRKRQQPQWLARWWR